MVAWVGPRVFLPGQMPALPQPYRWTPSTSQVLDFSPTELHRSVYSSSLWYRNTRCDMNLDAAQSRALRLPGAAMIFDKRRTSGRRQGRAKPCCFERLHEVRLVPLSLWGELDAKVQEVTARSSFYARCGGAGCTGRPVLRLYTTDTYGQCSPIYRNKCRTF